MKTAVKRSACTTTLKGVKRLRGQTMTFDEVLDQVRELLQRQGRVSYRALKLRFQLDDEVLEGVKDELIDAQRLAADEDGKVLVWTGAPPVPSSEFQVSSSQASAPSTQHSDFGPRTSDS